MTKARYRFLAPKVTEPKVILGESTQGTPITLLDSFYTAWREDRDWLKKGPVPIASSTLTSHAILIGVHLNDGNEPRFTSCKIGIPNLERWLDDRPFTIEMSEALKPICINTIYAMPSSKVFEISESIGRLRIAYSVTPPGPWDGTMVHRAFLVCDPPEPKNVKWFVETVGEITRLLTLLFGNEVQSTRMTLSRKGHSEEESDEEASLYFSRTRVEQPELNPMDFLTRYPTIQAVFPQMVSSWMTESLPIRHALNLLFSSIREPGAFLETRFLPIVQAAEVFARVAVPGHIAEPAEFTRVKNAVVSAIPSNVAKPLRDAIKNSLGFANELRLAQRLHALLDTLDGETIKLVCADRDKFVRGIVNTRNYFTHYTDRYDRVLQSVEIHWATIKLTTLLKLLLLKRIGLPEGQLRELFQNNHRQSTDRREWRDISEIGSPLNAGTETGD